MRVKWSLLEIGWTHQGSGNMHMGLSAMLSVSSDLYDNFIKTNILMQNLPTGRNSYLSELNYVIICQVYY